MLKWFKPKSKQEKLLKEYEQILDKAFKTSKINRAESDQLYARAKEIEDQINELDNSEMIK